MPYEQFFFMFATVAWWGLQGTCTLVMHPVDTGLSASSAVTYYSGI